MEQKDDSQALSMYITLGILICAVLISIIAYIFSTPRTVTPMG